MSDPRPVRLLAISGSLRASSSNTVVLRAVSALAPPGVEVELYPGLASLPPFNPDLEESDLPAVADFRARLNAADGVLIASPEYAHGVPGVLKNALDWVVGTGEFVGKPVALINPSPRSTYAQAQLGETLSVMMGVFVPGASVTLDLSSNRLDEASLLADPVVSAALRHALAALTASLR